MKKDTCLYLHKKPNGEIFYVGIGNSQRPYFKYRNNKYWTNVAKKHPDYIVEILEQDLTWQEACQKEIALIQQYKRWCDGGTLTNITIGGDGTKGRIVTDELKEIYRQKSLGNKNCVGFKHSDETRKNMSLSHIGKVIPEEIKLKMSLSHQGRKGRESDRINAAKAHEKNKGRVQSQDEKDKRAKSLSKKIIVEGITFESTKQCSEILNINFNTIRGRLLNQKFKNYQYAN